MTKDEKFEAQLTSSYLCGVASAYETLAGRFAENSGRAFAARQDSKAQWFRELSEQFEKEGKEARQAFWKHNKEFGLEPTK